MDERVEAVIDGLSNHLSSRDKLGIEPVEDVLEVFSLPGLFGVEKFEKLLDEGGSNVHFERLDISAIIDDELQEELIDRL